MWVRRLSHRDWSVQIAINAVVLFAFLIAGFFVFRNILIARAFEKLTAVNSSWGTLINAGDRTPQEVSEILKNRTGLGESGENFIVDANLKMQTESRFWKTREIHVDTPTVRAALALGSGSGIQKDYRGIWVLSFSSRLQTPTPQVLVSEIDYEEVTRPLYTLLRPMVLLFALALTVLSLATRFWLRRLLKLTEDEKLQSFVLGQEKERARLAAELHDGIAPRIAALGFQAANPRLDREQLASDIQETVLEVRSLTHELAPDKLRNFGFIIALNDFAAGLLNPREIKWQLQEAMPADYFNKLPWEKQLHLYRVLQEVLHNIVKHANATAIDIHFHFGREQLTIEITDNGCGIIPVANRGQGICNLNSRIQALHGRLSYTQSDSGKGLKTRITIPYLERLQNGNHTRLNL